MLARTVVPETHQHDPCHFLCRCDAVHFFHRQPDVLQRYLRYVLHPALRWPAEVLAPPVVCPAQRGLQAVVCDVRRCGYTPVGREAHLDVHPVLVKMGKPGLEAPPGSVGVTVALLHVGENGVFVDDLVALGKRLAWVVAVYRPAQMSAHLGNALNVGGIGVVCPHVHRLLHVTVAVDYSKTVLHGLTPPC